MLFFGAREFARLGFDCGEVHGRVIVFGAAAADHSTRHHEVAVARYKNCSVTVEIRRGQRGMQIVGQHHVTEHRFGDRREARFDFEHLDQPSGDAGRIDRRMRRDCGVGLLHEVHPARAILFENFDCAERELRRFDNHRVHLSAEHGFESRLERERRAHDLFENRRIGGRTIAVERFENRAESQVDAVRRVIRLKLAARTQHAAQRIDARRQMVERGARFDLALGRRAPRPFQLGCYGTRRFEVGFGRVHQFARGFELCREGRTFERRRFEALFEIGTLAREIAEPAANHRGFAHDVGQVVLAFFAAALGLLEFVIGGVVLERDFFQRGVGVAAARCDFARERRASLGAIRTRERCLRFELDQPRAQIDFELSGRVEPPLQKSAGAQALLRTVVKILELALRAAQLRPRRLRSRRCALDLLANRGGAGARAVERALQLHVAVGLSRQLFALIDESSRGRIALELAELRLDDLVGLSFFRLPAREA